MPQPLVDVRQLQKWYPLRRGFRAVRDDAVKAVDGVTFGIAAGEILGLVGESGCGKSTLARLLLNLLQPTGGSVCFDGRDIASLDRREMRELRKRMQIIFQDPHSSLNPRLSVGAMLREILAAHRLATASGMPAEIARILGTVGLEASHARRHPHEFSSGQRQRVGIARALAVQPEFVVCDEPVSALDVSIQAQILNLLMDLREEFHLTYLFISHDLHVVRHISDRIAVMYLGRIVEIGPAGRVGLEPLHPYTRALIGSAPVPDPRHGKAQALLSGDVPIPAAVPSGCAFHPRCPEAGPECARVRPLPGSAGEGHEVACLLYETSRDASERAHAAAPARGAA
ncbi:MAG: ABC transporter ATP-binding protein [Ignavibacteria bacterium]|nr:ABC transporter ATP-binding protein [Ignavibacteria bacterium]